MTLTFRPLHPVFAAETSDVDIGHVPSPTVVTSRLPCASSAIVCAGVALASPIVWVAVTAAAPSMRRIERRRSRRSALLSYGSRCGLNGAG